MDVAIEDQVRSRAYEIWEAEGRPSGRSLAHWDQALREIAMSAIPAKRSKKAAAGEAKAARPRRSARAVLN